LRNQGVEGSGLGAGELRIQKLEASVQQALGELGGLAKSVAQVAESQATVMAMVAALTPKPSGPSPPQPLTHTPSQAIRPPTHQDTQSLDPTARQRLGSSAHQPPKQNGGNMDTHGTRGAKGARGQGVGEVREVKEADGDHGVSHQPLLVSAEEGPDGEQSSVPDSLGVIVRGLGSEELWGGSGSEEQGPTGVYLA